MRLAVVFALLLGTTFTRPAAAADGLEWSWDAPRRFELAADVKLADWIVFTKTHNSDVRVTRFLLRLRTTCSDTGRGSKRAWAVSCRIDDLQIEAASTASDAGRLQPILDEIDAKLVGTTVELVHGADGRIKNYDIEGIDQSWRRENRMRETLRLVLGRAFAAFDLQLPKKGDARGRSWRQTGVLAMALPSAHGSVGQSVLVHEVGKDEGARVEILSDGHGIVGAGEMIAVQPGGPERPANMYDLTLKSVSVFDRELGTLVDRQYLVEGTPTASSLASEGTQGSSYVQGVRLQLLPEGEAPEPLGPNREVGLDDAEE